MKEKQKRCAQCKADLPEEKRNEWEQYRLGANMYFCCEGCKRGKVQLMQDRQAEAFAARKMKKLGGCEPVNEIKTQPVEEKKDTEMADLREIIRDQGATIDSLTERLAREQRKTRTMMGMVKLLMEEMEEQA